MSFNDDWQDPPEKEAQPQPPAAVERRRRRRKKTIVPWWVLAAAALVVILAIALLWTWALKAVKENKVPPTIAATPTFTQPLPTVTFTPANTPTTASPTDTPIPPPPTLAAEIAVGGWVKVIGTGDAGLSFRAGPGQENARLKILTDGTVLKVLDGPREDSGFNWWRLEEYLDGQPGVIGWTIDDYLEPTNAP